ncbi:SH3 domain-containing protein [Brucella sp. 21LCYQ03]|nr:SH3 domain-containing protein [Brucella sp. 21LCYQ03]
MLLFKKILYNDIARSLIFASALIAPVSASAMPATVTGNVNIRSGPGINYGKLFTLPAGFRLDAGPCRGSWCQINNRGYRGWVSARFIRFGGYAKGPIYPSNLYPDNDYRPSSSTTVIIGGGGWGPGSGWNPYWGRRIGRGVYPGWGTGWRHGSGPRYDPYARTHGGSGYHGWRPEWGVGPVRNPNWSGRNGFGRIGDGVRPNFGNMRPYHSGR